MCDASGRSYALEPVVMHINARSGNFVPGSDADFDRHDMVFEEIIRSRPRRRASHSIAGGFSPTVRGVYRIIAVLTTVEPIGQG